MSNRKTALIIGVGPGLGMSMAHRLGRAGYAIALVSRGNTRHAGYLSELKTADIEAEAFVADILDGDQIEPVLTAITERFGSVDLLYYGPGASDPGTPPKSITETDADDVSEAMPVVYSAIEVVRQVLPDMVERGEGGLLFAGGLSSVVPMPALGPLAIVSAALRNYALTLNAALADKGIYAGTLTIGGLIARGDIHTMVTANPAQFGDVAAHTLDPDYIAGTAWTMYTAGTPQETTFSAPGLG